LPFLSGRFGKVVFGLAIALLMILAFAADRATILFADSEKLVAHTHEVQTTLARLRTRMFQAQAARLDYVLTGNDEALALLDNAKTGLTGALEHLRSLTIDNSLQSERGRALEPLLAERLALLNESVALQKSNPHAQGRQIEITSVGRRLTQQISDQLDEMNSVLAAAFGTVLLILAMDFRRLSIELSNRKEAEAAVRRLSARVLQLQDAERRKVARELHDSIGQYFVSLSMSLDLLQNTNLATAKRDAILAESLEMVKQGAAETRTLSYLLHPPLLDEAGFASAARWYVEGFAERSKIAVKLDVDPRLGRLAPEVELVLFRVLQECLGNIHRHSGSSRAEIRVHRKGAITLSIEDYGKGIPKKLLDEFRTTNLGAGVGLAGMRERVREIGGVLNITSEGSGTLVEVVVPPERAQESRESSGPTLPEESGSTAKVGVNPERPDIDGMSLEGA